MSPKIPILNHFTSRYPIQVAGLLQHYNLDQNQPIIAIQEGIEKYGDQFILDLYKITEGQTLNNDGEQKTEKKQWLQILQGVFGAGNALLNKPKAPETDKDDEKSKSWMWIGAGLILVLIFSIIIIVKNGK